MVIGHGMRQFRLAPRGMLRPVGQLRRIHDVALGELGCVVQTRVGDAIVHRVLQSGLRLRGLHLY